MTSQGIRRGAAERHQEAGTSAQATSHQHQELRLRDMKLTKGMEEGQLLRSQAGSGTILLQTIASQSHGDW